MRRLIFELVAVFALGATENDRQRLGFGEQVKIYNELSQIEQGADVWIDFTAPSAVFENVKFAFKTWNVSRSGNYRLDR